MQKISAIISAYNEAENLPSLFENIKDCDEIIVIDHLSTDNTPKLAKKLGAKVIIKPFEVEPVSQHSVDDFQKRYGFTPFYKAGEQHPLGSVEQNGHMKYTKNDWILWIDCDERLTWDFQKVQETMDISDVISCKFIHQRNPDGTPEIQFATTKLARKSKTWYKGRVHQALVGYDIRTTYSPDMIINHYQINRQYRAGYLTQLEYAYYKDEDERTCFYLLREYFNHRKFDQCIQFANIYLKTAHYAPEICKVFTYMAACYWEMGKEVEAHNYCFNAIKSSPKAKEPYRLMAQMMRPNDAVVWRKIADFVDGEEL